MPRLYDLSLDERIALYQRAMKINGERGWGCFKIARELGVTPSTLIWKLQNRTMASGENDTI